MNIAHDGQNSDHCSSIAMSTTSTPPLSLLFLNLPPKTLVGINLLSFNSSPKFHGVTNIPPGLLFLYTGTDASFSIRHGIWLNLHSSSPTRILTWNDSDESLSLVDLASQQARKALNSLNFLQKRGQVDYHALEDASETLSRKQDRDNGNTPTTGDASDWPELSSHISASVLSRILGSSRTLSSVSSAPGDAESIPGLSHLESSSVLGEHTTLNFVSINLKQTWGESDIGRERTDRARDRSWYLSQLLDGLSDDKQRAAKEMLGEMQVCFLMVLTLANYSALEQWKRILGVVLTCRAALREVEGYFMEVLKVLKAQMEHVEDVDGGLFEMRDEEGSKWMRNLLTGFRGIVDEELEDGSKLGGVLGELEGMLRERYGWEKSGDIMRRGMLELEDGERVEVSMQGVDEDEETGEYAPIVVET